MAVDEDVGLWVCQRPAPTAAAAGGVGLNKLHRLDEHPRRAAAGVVNSPAVGLEHFYQELRHAARRVKLAALDIADQVNELAKTRLVQCGAGALSSLSSDTSRDSFNLNGLCNTI